MATATMPPEPRSPVLIRSTVILNTAFRGTPILRAHGTGSARLT
jgi:hypothetical protein